MWDEKFLYSTVLKSSKKCEFWIFQWWCSTGTVFKALCGLKLYNLCGLHAALNQSKIFWTCFRFVRAEGKNLELRQLCKENHCTPVSNQFCHIFFLFSAVCCGFSVPLYEVWSFHGLERKKKCTESCWKHQKQPKLNREKTLLGGAFIFIFILAPFLLTGRCWFLLNTTQNLLISSFSVSESLEPEKKNLGEGTWGVWICAEVKIRNFCLKSPLFRLVQRLVAKFWVPLPFHFFWGGLASQLGCHCFLWLWPLTGIKGAHQEETSSFYNNFHKRNTQGQSQFFV